MFATSPHLDGQYTVWGKVIEGMEHVDNITRGDINQGGVVPEARRDRIVKMVVASDVKK